MANVAIVIGLALTALGLIGYYGSGAASPTALIPSFFGILLLGLGVAGRPHARRKTMMHLAAGVALLGMLGTISGVVKYFRYLSGEPVERYGAVVSQAIMFALCLVFLVLAVRSFVSARRSRVLEGK